MGVAVSSFPVLPQQAVIFVVVVVIVLVALESSPEFVMAVAIVKPSAF